MAKRNGARTLSGKPVSSTEGTAAAVALEPTTETPVVETASAENPVAETPTHNQELTGTADHNGTPAVVDKPATAALVAATNSKVITGIPYDGTLHLTGATFPFRGNRKLIYDLLKEGMNVAEFCKLARNAARGGVEDVRIYVRKGLVVVKDKEGVQVMPPPAPVPVQQ